MSNPIVDQIRVAPGTPAGLATRDPADRLGVADKDTGRAAVKPLLDELRGLQARLWAEDRRSVLLVLQGMDAAGKDGAIRKVFGGVNPQGVQVAGFKKPSSNELEHDYLWRVHKVCPRRGELGIFNRSHYEDVVTVGVLGIAPWEVAKRRIDHINNFEQMLVDEGTTIVKVFLHLSREEQRRRLQERIDTPEKHWKFNMGDLDVRAKWDEFQAAYDETITATSTAHAPWHILPVDRKWVRDIGLATLLVETLRGMDPQAPPPDPGLHGLVVPA